MRARTIAIEARDGLTLHGMLTLPAGETQNLPLIVNVHGGPFGITDRWGFQPEAQYFAHQGYATLQVNFRGSGNRGSDVRVVVGHAERLRAALDKIGKSYEWMLKEEEGHGFYAMDSRVDLYEGMLEFFDRHIGPDAPRGD